MIEPLVEPFLQAELANVSQAACHSERRTTFRQAKEFSIGLRIPTRLLLLVASILCASLATGHIAIAQTEVEATGPTESTSPIEVPDTLPALLQMIETRYESAQALQGEARIKELATVRMLLGQIAEAFPASDEALSLALGEKVGKVDLAVLDAELAILGSQETLLTQSVPVQVDPTLAGLSACMVGSDLPEGDSSVRIRIRVELDDSGNIMGMPDLIDPSSPDEAVLKVFQRSLIALYGCPGLKSFDLPTAVEISLKSVAVESATAIPSMMAREVPMAEVTELESKNQLLPDIEPALVFADAEAEKALELRRLDIAELQVRLELLGFDPNGIDGVAGRGMRKAITDWQLDRMIPPSGFVDGIQFEKLRAETRDAFSVWIAKSGNSDALDRASKPLKKATRSKGRPVKPSGARKWYRDGRGWYCTPTILGAMCQRYPP